MSDGILNPIQQLQADFDFDVYTKQEVDTLLDGKADKVDTYTKTETDDLLSEKADKSTTLAGYGITDAYTKTQTDNLLNGKADTNSVYTKEETDNLLSVKANSADVYTKTEANNLLSAKADSVNVYTKTEADTLLAGKADTDDVYTKAQTDTLLSVKANSADVYTKIESNTLLAGKANVDDVYTKTEIDNQLTVTKDGTWVKVAQNTAINLEKLEGGIEYLYGLLSYKYSQLKKYINGNYYDYETNTDTAYTKAVPAGAMPYAGLEQIGGKTLVWNQLNNTIQVTTTQDGLTFTNNNDGSWTINGTATADGNINIGEVALTTHKYFLKGCPSGGSNTTYGFGIRGNYNSPIYLRDYGSGAILAWGGNHPSSRTVFCYHSGDVFNNATFLPQIIDLTLAFGSGNEPSTVEEFKAMFPAEYYPYNAGTLLSAGVTEVVSQGRNLANLSQVTYMDMKFANDVFTNTATDSKTAIAYTAQYYRNSTYIGSAFPQIIVSSVGVISKTFTVPNNINANKVRIGHSGASKDLKIDIPFSFDAGETYTLSVDFVGVNPTVVGGFGFDKLQIEKGSTATAYSPYHVIDYPIPAEIRNLEGYGWSAGSVYNYIDFERKVFVQRVASVDLGTLNWVSTTREKTIQYFYTNSLANDMWFEPNSNTAIAHIVCPKYTIGRFTDVYNNTVQCMGVGGGYGNPTGRLAVYDASSSSMTAEQYKSSLSNVMLYYRLKTPIETDISAYLTDDNLISVESGGTLTFPNSNGDNYRIPVPSTQEYMINLQEAVSNG